MDNEFEEDPGQFKLKMDDGIDETAMDLNVDELRLEKISQRVTFISILIPVLIIIVLVIAYLDIKKRMSYTEDTGTMEFQKLSSDLESRFGSLSLRQAKLEETMIRFSQTQNQSMANSNVKLDQLGKTMDSLQRQFVTQKAFKKVRGDFNQQDDALRQQDDALRQEISAVAQSVDRADQQIADMTQELKAQIAKIGAILMARNQRLEELEQRIAEVDGEKIDQQGFDLKLRLAALQIQQDLKIELDALNTELKALNKRMSQLSTQKASTPTPAPQKKAAPKPIKQPPAGIEEQTIKQ